MFGCIRLLLTGAAGLLLVGVSWPEPVAWPAFAAVGLSLVLGALVLIPQAPTLLKSGIFLVVADAALITALVVGTGGPASPFLSLYTLAALEIVLVRSPVRSLFGSGAVIGGYFSAQVVTAGIAGVLLSVEVWTRAGIILVLCASAALLGAKLRNTREESERLSRDLSAERSSGERTETLLPEFGAGLKMLGLGGVLQWTAETARDSLEIPYAHVATPEGNHHRTATGGERKAYPSWWHPEIQRLVLWCSRTGEVHHCEEDLHGTKGFTAIPIVSTNGSQGALIVGGREFDAEDERVLRLISEQTASAFEGLRYAPAGRDPVSGLPNRSSLHHVLQKELSLGTGVTVLVVGLDHFRSYNQVYGLSAGDKLLCRIGEKLTENQQRVFHYGGDQFIVILGPRTGGGTSYKSAAGLQRLIADLTKDSAVPLSASVGYATALPEDTDPATVLDAALGAMLEAKNLPDGISGREASVQANPSPRPEMVRHGGAVISLLEAIRARDPYLEGHLRSVSQLALHLGERMRLSTQELESLVTGALLHDVGKIGIPDTILQKSGHLNPEEYETMKQHPMLGARIVEPLKELVPALPAIKHHHERFDGKGYPDGLRGKEVPLTARITFVADAFDSMVRNRVYRHSIPAAEALEEVVRNSGSQFDPDVVEALISVVGRTDGWRSEKLAN